MTVPYSIVFHYEPAPSNRGNTGAQGPGGALSRARRPCVNASTKNSFNIPLPGAGSYTDLYGKSVGDTVAMSPVSGLVLLRKGAPTTKEEGSR